MARQRLDRITRLRIEVHVLAPAAGFENKAPCPPWPGRPLWAVELQMHLFAWAEDGDRAVRGGDELRDRPFGRVVAARVTCIPQWNATIVVIGRSAALVQITDWVAGPRQAR